ncbi:hypothetical protein ACHAWF_008557 [Thalassiosira exigua]
MSQSPNLRKFSYNGPSSPRPASTTSSILHLLAFAGGRNPFRFRIACFRRIGRSEDGSSLNCRFGSLTIFFSQRKRKQHRIYPNNAAMSPVTLPLHLQPSSSPSPSRPPSDPYLLDHLRHMVEQESSHYQISESHCALPASSTVTPADRRTMISWAYDIADACSVDREVACVAASHFDRLLRSEPSSPSCLAVRALSSRRDYQLAFVACLVVSLKCRAGMRVDADFVSDAVCRKMYAASEVVRAEKEVLAALEWRLNGPSPQDFLGGWIELMPPAVGAGSRAAKEVAAEATKLAEEAVMEGAATPSSIAREALLRALKAADFDDLGPLDRWEWMRAIDEAMGAPRGVREPLPSLALGEGSSRSLWEEEEEDEAAFVCPPPVRYCSPVAAYEVSPSVSADDEDLYLDSLSTATDYASDVSDFRY